MMEKIKEIIKCNIDLNLHQSFIIRENTNKVYKGKFIKIKEKYYFVSENGEIKKDILGLTEKELKDFCFSIIIVEDGNTEKILWEKPFM